MRGQHGERKLQTTAVLCTKQSVGAHSCGQSGVPVGGRRAPLVLQARSSWAAPTPETPPPAINHDGGRCIQNWQPRPCCAAGGPAAARRSRRHLARRGGRRPERSMHGGTT